MEVWKVQQKDKEMHEKRFFSKRQLQENMRIVLTWVNVTLTFSITL